MQNVAMLVYRYCPPMITSVDEKSYQVRGVRDEGEKRKLSLRDIRYESRFRVLYLARGTMVLCPGDGVERTSKQ